MLTCLAMMENNLIDFLQARSLNNNLSFSRCPLAPSMYKDKDGTLLIVHVDDVQGMGKEQLHEKPAEKYITWSLHTAGKQSAKK